MDFEDLTPELQEKARAAQSPEDMLAIANEAGYELSDDELEAISGGYNWCWSKCMTKDCRNYFRDAEY